MRRVRIITTAVLGACLATTPALAGASDEPGPSAAVQREAERIVDTVPSHRPLEVVTTTLSDGAPQFTTTVADDRREATDLVASELVDPETVGVDMVHPVHIAASNDTYRSRQWALTRFKAEVAWKTATGRGVTVAVVDTGVRWSHRDLGGRVLTGVDLVDPRTAASDENGHGTHVAGIIAAMAGNKRGIAGLARHARILPVRVLDKKGGGDTVTLARGIVWAVDHGADVVNLSLTAGQPDSATRAAVNYAISRNVVVVAAAGNRRCGGVLSPTTWPAAYDGVIGVGSITSSASISSFSTCGRHVDVVAPGTGIVSLMTRKPHRALGCRPDYCTMSGTSMAAPYVAATAALLIQRRGAGWKATEVTSAITSSAVDRGTAGYDTRYGWGVLDPRRALAR